jgi:hypothetical protein
MQDSPEVVCIHEPCGALGVHPGRIVTRLADTPIWILHHSIAKYTPYPTFARKTLPLRLHVLVELSPGSLHDRLGFDTTSLTHTQILSGDFVHRHWLWFVPFQSSLLQVSGRENAAQCPIRDKNSFKVPCIVKATFHDQEEMMEGKSGKGLRILGIVLFAITTAMNILGGIGTVCAAFLTEKYEMVSIMSPVDYRWLYQTLMIITVLIGLTGIWATLALFRGRERAFQNALILLMVGTLVSGIHFYASMSIRGSATPANMKFFANVITLFLFIVFSLPGMRERVPFDAPGDSQSQMTSGGLAAMITGILILSVKGWVGESHVHVGNNWVDVIKIPLLIGGFLLTLSGLSLLTKLTLDPVLRKSRNQAGQLLF